MPIAKDRAAFDRLATKHLAACAYLLARVRHFCCFTTSAQPVPTAVQVKDILAFTVTVSCQDNQDACARVMNEVSTMAWKLKQVGAGAGGSRSHAMGKMHRPRGTLLWGLLLAS